MTTEALCLREIDALFEPYAHRKLSLPTRLVMASVPRLYAQNGVPVPEMLRYYRRRAENQVGLIISEPVAVNDPAAAGDSGMSHFYGGAALRGWKQICQAVHASRCRIMPLLHHVGMLRPLRGDIPNPSEMAIGPSGIDPQTGGRRGESMSRERIRSVVSAFASAAYSAKVLGFDGVEINGAHAGLVEQFLRPETNRRTDEYGGDMPGRVRFACQIIHAVRKAVGRAFPVAFRYSPAGELWGKPLLESPHEMELFLNALCEAGVDIFECDGVSTPAFRGSPLSAPAWTRLLSHRPVIASGGIGLPGGSLLPHVRGMLGLRFDLLAVGRALLADAEWGTKVRESREADIVPFSSRSWLHLD